MPATEILAAFIWSRTATSDAGVPPRPASANRAVGDAARGAGSAAMVLVVVATVAVTEVGGFVAGELRQRRGTVLASVGLHWATNSLGVLFGLIAWHLAA